MSVTTISLLYWTEDRRRETEEAFVELSEFFAALPFFLLEIR